MTIPQSLLAKSKTLLLLGVGMAVFVGILGFFYEYSQRSKASTNPAYFSFASNTFQTGLSESNPLTIQVQTNEKKMSIGTILIKIPSIVEFDEEMTRDNPGGCTSLENLIDARVLTHSDGKVLVLTRASTKADADLPSGAFCFAKVYFKGKTMGTETQSFVLPSSLSLDGWEWDLAGPDGEFEAHLTEAAPSVEVIVTTNPTSPTAKVNYRIKFQGVTGQPKNASSIDTKLGIYRANGEQIDSRSVAFTPQADGTWVADTEYKNIPNIDYYVTIKGPKHLRKKICEINPKEIVSGTYRCKDGGINFKEGNNTFDFSQIYMLGGDLPLQNGIIDAVDIVYIRSNLGSQAAEVIARGDLNYDDIVDSQDYGIIINALSFKYDEEE